MPFSKSMMRENRGGVKSLYIHCPFCLKKCPYCSFYSVPYTLSDVEAFISALEREVSWWKGNNHKIYPLETLYLGGGTPSIFSTKNWERILSILERNFEFSPEVEVTVEANPESVTENKLSLWKNWRVTRISLGVQSLQDEELRWLQRPYNAETVYQTLDLLKKYEFNLSCDLMFAFKDQALRSWYNTLKQLVKTWHPDHISTYQLSLEPGTPWGDNPPSGIADGYCGYRLAQWYLPKKGYSQYEIASFAKKDRYSRHNLAYWFQKNVIGLGPSAWGYINGKRYRNNPELENYICNAGKTSGNAVYTETLDNEGRAREAVILALRTIWGFSISDFRVNFGNDVINNILHDIKDVPEGYINYHNDRIYLTSRGMRVGNSIWDKII